MLREQAIFFEVMEDLQIEGSTDIIILTYHDFITGFDFSSATDVQIHERAVEYLKKENSYWRDYEGVYHKRHDVLEKLDLEGAKWEYRDHTSVSIE